MRIIFMCVGIAKVDEKSITKELSHMSIVLLNALRADLLICTNNFPVLFGVELRGQFGGID
jgi:hypothetical protein